MRGRWTPSSNGRAPGWRPSSFIGCAIYIRQSVSRPDDAFSSCEAQRAACLEFLGRQEELWLPLGGVFEDVGESGATLDRPGLKALLERLMAGDVERVVVHRLDRLTRNFRHWLKLTGFFKDQGVTLSVVSGDFHATQESSPRTT